MDRHHLASWLSATVLALGGAALAAAPADLPADYFLRDSKVLNVAPTTDADNSYSDVIGPDGGQLTTLDAVGNTYTLTVPKGALGFPEELTMTPLTALKGMPFKGGVNAGVQLEPEGTFFVKPVKLEVEFAEKPNLKDITPFGYTGAGQDFTTTMLMHDPGHYVFLLNHFSGAGFANSTEPERTVEVARQPLAAEERISQSVRQALEAAHEDAVRAEEFGQQTDPATQAAVVDAFSKAVKAYKNEVLDPLRAGATQSCAAGMLYVQTLLGVERQIQMMGGEEAAPEADPNAGKTWGETPVPGIATLVGVIMYGDSPKAGEPSKAQAASTLMDALTQPEKEENGQTERSITEKINLKCLDEEAQSCYQTGDIFRLVQWRLGAERQAQLSTFGTDTQKKLGPNENRTGYLDAPYEKALKACSHFEVQFNSTLTQKGAANLAGVFPQNSVASLLQGQGVTNYHSAMTSVLPIKIETIGQFGIPGELPNGNKSLPYAGYGMSYTFNGSTLGLPANCVEAGTSTSPGLIAATFFPEFDPADPNAANPALDGLSPAQKRILVHVPKVGLLAPPRRLNLEKTILTIGVGNPTEHTQSSCGDQKTYDPTTWLDSWNKQLKNLGKGGTVLIGHGLQNEPGWQLNKWQEPNASSPKLVTFPLKIVQDVPHHEAASGVSYDETWHLDITVVHTPKEDQ